MRVDDIRSRIAPKCGISFKLRAGDLLRVYDPMGEQVADLFAFRVGDSACSLSSGRSIDYADKIYRSCGDLLYSNDSQVMFSIVTDTVGRHDFLLTPCSQEMVEKLYLRAEMNLVCGLTACSAEQSNNGAFKPIDFSIARAAETAP